MIDVVLDISYVLVYTVERKRKTKHAPFSKLLIHEEAKREAGLGKKPVPSSPASVPEKPVAISSPSFVPAVASGKKSPNKHASISAAASESAHDYMKYEYRSKDPQVFEKA